MGLTFNPLKHAARSGICTRIVAAANRRSSSCSSSQAAGNADIATYLHSRAWLLEHPAAKVQQVESDSYRFAVVRDDLLHPLIGGNKLRKMDALIPSLLSSGATDVVTCGGLQSAHTAAIAAACAEHGLAAHLLVRGERPQVPTGFHLLTRMLGAVTYVSRSEYSNREAMFAQHVELLQQRLPRGAKVAVVPEGGGEALALLGLLRLVHWLATATRFRGQATSIVVDTGTGTTAAGVALGAWLMGQPWEVHAVMLAGDEAYYKAHCQHLLLEFWAQHGAELGLHQEAMPHVDQLPLKWVPRRLPRKFGKVLPGEVAMSRQVAQRHGVVLDPIYTLAAWECACDLSSRSPGRAPAPTTFLGCPHRTVEATAADADIAAGGAGAALGADRAEEALTVGSGLKGVGSSAHPAAEVARGGGGEAAGRVAKGAGGAGVEALHGGGFAGGTDDREVLMLHTGGMLGLFGLAQRFPDDF